jgi:hypothetical protein
MARQGEKCFLFVTFIPVPGRRSGVYEAAFVVASNVSSIILKKEATETQRRHFDFKAGRHNPGGKPLILGHPPGAAHCRTGQLLNLAVLASLAVPAGRLVRESSKNRPF